MDSALRTASVAEVKGAIARLILEESSSVPAQLGRVQLKVHQQSAVARLRSAIDEFGGAILCDPVGTGKTFAAIALASDRASTIVVAPAVLREMWIDAFEQCDRSHDFISFEALSRGGSNVRRCDFVIVDEAHHVRNRLTRRFQALSRLVAGVPVVLLTATPIHNRQSDLTALISLFLGERADCLTSSELARLLIRRDELSRSVPSMPRVCSLTRVRVPENHGMPELLLSLPPPLPVRDGSDGGVLIAHSLIREWASSDSALIGGLRRRLIRAESLSAALADGTWPSRAELASWIAGDDAVQLGLAGLLASASSNTRDLRSIVKAHAAGLREILDVARISRTDDQRVEEIKAIRRAHPGRRIVAFSQYADTIEGLFRIISRDGKVAALTGSGARVSGGRISRSDAIASFAPRASHRHSPKSSDEITLLLTTDLLSEGVNLQDAGVVIHLDLPWTPARMEQRLGRVARIGSLQDSVRSYAILPPISAESAIRIEGILRDKIEAASLIVPEWPALGGFDRLSAPPAPGPEVSEASRSMLSRWISEKNCSNGVAAGVIGAENGFVAVVEHRGFVRVVTQLGTKVSDDAALLLDCLERITSIEAFFGEHRSMQCEKTAVEWLESKHAFPFSRSPMRNRAARTITRIVSGARAFERTQVAREAQEALEVLSGNLGTYEESLVDSALKNRNDRQVLNAVLGIGRSSRTCSTAIPKVLAMLVVVRE